MRVKISELSLPLESAGDPLPELRGLLRKQGVADTQLATMGVLQRALDARKRPPRFVYTVTADLPEKLADKLVRSRKAAPYAPAERYRYRVAKAPDGPRPVVVGAGPAGLFAALTLAEAGMPPIVFERGHAVEERTRAVSRLYQRGELNTDSNVCYGEGGAGTYSDGKLYTRVGDGRVDRVLELLVERGADPFIRINNRPHLGTDKLVRLLRNIRAHLTELGVDFRFDTAIDDFVIADGTLKSLKLRDGASVDVSRVVLATGHSSREIWQKLFTAGLPLECRPFAVGFRVEHPQAMIDQVRYGQLSERGFLPAADYRLTYNEDDGRGVWSFCMCPGGVVVTTPTHPGELCINGMSHASRSGKYANSALVVSVGPQDFAAAGHTGVFAGVDFQLDAERKAYAAGGGDFVAPASRVADFAAGVMSPELGATSYRRGIVPADIGQLYPAPVIAALKRALQRFDRSMRGFITNEAKLIGVETRTSSPVRVPRGDDLQALGARGLYPAGEGMGYGGGIVSAAVDGIRAAEAVLEHSGAVREILKV